MPTAESIGGLMLTQYVLPFEIASLLLTVGADRRDRDRARRLDGDSDSRGLRHFLVLGSILFALGMYGVLSRRNAIGILLSIELMLNGVNMLMVAFARYISRPTRSWPARCSRSSS